MPDFMLQENPEVSPKSCYFCHAHEGPFVNTMTTDMAGQIILMCAPQEDGRQTGCAGAVVQAIGGLTPAGARKVKDQRDEAVTAHAALEQRLADLRLTIAGAVE